MENKAADVKRKVEETLKTAREASKLLSELLEEKTPVMVGTEKCKAPDHVASDECNKCEFFVGCMKSIAVPGLTALLILAERTGIPQAECYEFFWRLFEMAMAAEDKPALQRVFKEVDNLYEKYV